MGLQDIVDVTYQIVGSGFSSAELRNKATHSCQPKSDCS
ncbi:hypothetical protein VCR3J2_80742 [Vibrio coralliirubri]|nr:hypothetical protein VCR3J2_80742 [Vibrio coralliirubri]